MAEHDGAAERSPPDSIPDVGAENVDETSEQHQPFFSMCPPIRSVSYSNSWEGFCASAANDPVSWSPSLTDNREDKLVQDTMDMEQSKDGFDVSGEESNQQPEPLSTEQPDSNQNEWDTWPVETNHQPLPLDSNQPNCNIDTAPYDMEVKRFPFFSCRRQPKYVGAGLSNMGNTCFLNATLQCITHTVPVVLKLRSIDHFTPCSFDKDGFCSFCALKEHVEESIQRSGSVIMPVKFRDNLRNLCSDFRPGQQEDAHEFLRCLLDNLHKCTTDPESKGKGSSFDEESMVKQVFGGQLKNQLSCCECGHTSETFEPFLDLSLEINQVDNLVDALKSFTKVEQVGDSKEKLTCEHCKAKVYKNKQLTLDKAPDVVAFQLKRFTTIDNCIEKIEKLVSYPPELDLKPFHSNPDTVGELKYDLYGVVVHSGLLPDYGHYVCTIRSSPGTWYSMNDSRVDSISDANALNQEAYILFYVRQGKFPWFSTLLDSKYAQPDESSRGASPVSVLENIDPNCSTSSGEGTSSSDDNLMKNETRHCKESDKDETSHCRSSFLPGESSRGSLLSASKSSVMENEISPCSTSHEDDISVRYPCTMETTNLDTPSTPPRSKRLSPDLDFSVFDFEDYGNDDKETPLMPELKFQPKLKKTKAASASKAIKSSCVDQNAMHLIRGMPSTRRRGLLECMPTYHNAKQESRRCPASDPVDKKKRKVIQC